MTAAKHTPGPWHVNDERGDRWIETDSDDVIARVCRADVKREQFDANARLIAAAPELLEALRRLLPAYREAVKLWDCNHDDAFTVQAHNAIAKATGDKQ